MTAYFYIDISYKQTHWQKIILSTARNNKTHFTDFNRSKEPRSIHRSISIYITNKIFIRFIIKSNINGQTGQLP